MGGRIGVRGGRHTLGHKTGNDPVPRQAVIEARADKLLDAGTVLGGKLGEHLEWEKVECNIDES
jgi:hypothetical protein